jgi:pimeloyl-ACP methyl ester carboxylesterase
MGPWYNFRMVERIYSHKNGTVPYLEGGSGPNLLFLHGAFAMPHAYEPLLTLLSQTFHVIAPTHPGHGKSFKISQVWTYTDYIDMYRQFMKDIRCTPSVIVGHSFGGAFALSLASDVPNAEIIVLESAGLPYPFIVKDFLVSLFKEGEEAIKKDPNMQTVQELSRAAHALTVSFGQHPENIPWFYRYGPTLDLTALLTTLPNPVGLLWGENDTIVPLSVGERMRSLLPYSILKTYPGFKHNYVITQPEFTHAEILEMLSILSSLPQATGK